MPRSNAVVAALERARQSLTQDILTQALADLSPDTTMGEVVASMKAAGFGNTFAEMSLNDFSGALNGAAPRPRGRKPGRPAGRKPGRPAKAVAKGGKVNTRTEAGREAYGAAVAQALSSKGTAAAGDLRAAAGGSAAQVRQALDRLMAAGKVSKSGQKRGTVYAWGRGAARKAGASKTTRKKGGGRKKKAARKTTAKKTTSKAAAAAS